MEAHADFCGAVEETFEMIHRSGRQIVQHHQAPWLRTALIQRPDDPSTGIAPVAGDGVPEHAAIFVASQVIDDRGL